MLVSLVWKLNVASKLLSLHVADQDLIPSTAYDLLSPTKSNS